VSIVDWMAPLWMITLGIEPSSGMGGEDDSVVTINNDSTINSGRGNYGTLTHSSFSLPTTRVMAGALRR
jgi:hypothetical protein